MADADDLRIEAWLNARNKYPITAIDDNGYGVMVQSDHRLARERLPVIRLMLSREQTAVSHWYRKHGSGA